MDRKPIEWIVLDIQDERALLLSKNILDTQQYNTEQVPTTWETSSIRSWLNHTFLNQAFTSEEQEKILFNHNSKSGKYRVSNCRWQ